MANVKLVPQDKTYQYQNQLTMSNSWKFGTHQYGFNIKNEQNTNQLFVLSQSYDPAWLALALPSDLEQTFPPKMLAHLKYNGWANAWLVPPGDYQVYLIYFPQIISFMGMIMVVFTLTWFIFFLVRTKKTKPIKKYTLIHHFLLGDHSQRQK